MSLWRRGLMTSLKAVLLRMAALISLFLWVAWIGLLGPFGM